MPSPYSAQLSQIAAQAIEQLNSRHQARERALAVSREVIRFSANAIRAVHRAELDEARREVNDLLRAVIVMEKIR